MYSLCLLQPKQIKLLRFEVYMFYTLIKIHFLIEFLFGHDYPLLRCLNLFIITGNVPKNAYQIAALRSWCNHDPCCHVRQTSKNIWALARLRFSPLTNHKPNKYSFVNCFLLDFQHQIYFQLLSCLHTTEPLRPLLSSSIPHNCLLFDHIPLYYCTS